MKKCDICGKEMSNRKFKTHKCEGTPDTDQTPSPDALLGKESEATEEATEVTETPEEATEGSEATEEATEEAKETTEDTAETTETEETTEASEETPKSEEEQSLEELVAGLPEELREKALEQIGKLRVQASKNEAAKAFAEFDKALKDEETGLPKFLGDLIAKHHVDLSGRKIVITYPDGKFNYSNSPKNGKTNGSRNGFPGAWGEAQLLKGDKVEKTAASPSKLAEEMNLQVEGKRNMIDVFENPTERGTKAELPKKWKVDAKKGEYFRVYIQ